MQVFWLFSGQKFFGVGGAGGPDTKLRRKWARTPFTSVTVPAAFRPVPMEPAKPDRDRPGRGSPRGGMALVEALRGSACPRQPPTMGGGGPDHPGCDTVLRGRLVVRFRTSRRRRQALVNARTIGHWVTDPQKPQQNRTLSHNNGYVQLDEKTDVNV